jgi:apolipoprotein N-acyltransferase
LALALSLPPWGWWPLAFGGAALLYWRLAGLRARTRLWAGWVAGLGCFVPGLAWAREFNWYGAVVLMAVEALSMGAAALLVPPERARWAAFPAAFTLAEAVRTAFPFGGLPIGGVFLGQAGGPFLGTARVGGPLLLGGMVWLGGAALGELALAASARGRAGVRATTGAVLLGAVVAFGVAGALAPDGGPDVGHLRVAAVQGGGRRGVTVQEGDPSDAFAAQLAATAPLGHRGPGPRLVVWPEDVVALNGPLAGSPQARDLSTVARRLRATVVAGVTEPASPTTFYNKVVAWGPTGRVVGSFEKVHRVPFGEYVPWRGFFAHFASLAGVPRTAVPGHGSGLLRTPAAPLGVLVSYEVFYAARGRSSVRDGAELLVVATNASSYSASQVPAQELAAARVQAVEEGRDLVQAAPTGLSAVVDAGGGVVERTVLGRRQVLTGTVALRAGRTLYERFGDLPPLVLSAALLALGWVAAARRRRIDPWDGFR